MGAIVADSRRQDESDWFTNVLTRRGITFGMISLVTPDGAADGQAALRLLIT